MNWRAFLGIGVAFAEARLCLRRHWGGRDGKSNFYEKKLAEMAPMYATGRASQTISPAPM